jgi:hypothetical protein
VLSSQQELFDPPRLLAARDVPGDESANVMSVMRVDDVGGQDAPKGANVPSYVSEAYYENEALADAIEKKIIEGAWIVARDGTSAS